MNNRGLSASPQIFPDFDNSFVVNLLYNQFKQQESCLTASPAYRVERTLTPMSATTVKNLVNQPYKYGFITDIESETIPRGLNEEIIRLISAKKKEPEFMLDFRLRAYHQWQKMTEPSWPHVSYPAIDYQNIIYY
ncbi:MAG: Fe-S cluster assembly protein SufB, partial [Microcystis sp.]